MQRFCGINRLFAPDHFAQYETAKIIPSVRNLNRLTESLREMGTDDYKLDILRQRHENALKVSTGKVIGSVLRG